MKNFDVWLEELQAMDSLENHANTLHELQLDFLSTNAADCRHTRLEVVWLLNHFAKLLKK